MRHSVHRKYCNKTVSHVAYLVSLPVSLVGLNININIKIKISSFDVAANN